MPASIEGGTATKPNQLPSGVRGNSSATASAIRDDAVSRGSAWLL